MADPVITAIVVLRCGACLTNTMVEVPAELCPGSPFHIHINTEDPRVGGWYRSHHQPGADILAVRKEAGGGRNPQDR